MTSRKNKVLRTVLGLGRAVGKETTPSWGVPEVGFSASSLSGDSSLVLSDRYFFESFLASFLKWSVSSMLELIKELFQPGALHLALILDVL